MRLLDALVEQLIAAAAARGEFDETQVTYALPELDDDLRVPVEVQIANWILKTSGFVPPTVEQVAGSLQPAGRDARGVRNRTTCCRLQAKILALDMALESLRGGPLVVQALLHKSSEIR